MARVPADLSLSLSLSLSLCVCVCFCAVWPSQVSERRLYDGVDEAQRLSVESVAYAVHSHDLAATNVHGRVKPADVYAAILRAYFTSSSSNSS